MLGSYRKHFHRKCPKISDLLINFDQTLIYLTHWGWVTHICVSKLTIIGSDNGLSPDRRQAIIRTNAEILPIGPLRTKLSDILIAIRIFSFKKMHLKMLSGKWRPRCLGLNVLMAELRNMHSENRTDILYIVHGPDMTTWHKYTHFYTVINIITSTVQFHPNNKC